MLNERRINKANKESFEFIKLSHKKHQIVDITQNSFENQFKNLEKNMKIFEMIIILKNITMAILSYLKHINKNVSSIINLNFKAKENVKTLRTNNKNKVVQIQSIKTLNKLDSGILSKSKRETEESHSIKKIRDKKLSEQNMKNIEYENVSVIETPNVRNNFDFNEDVGDKNIYFSDKSNKISQFEIEKIENLNDIANFDKFQIFKTQYREKESKEKILKNKNYIIDFDEENENENEKNLMNQSTLLDINVKKGINEVQEIIKEHIDEYNEEYDDDKENNMNSFLNHTILEKNNRKDIQEIHNNTLFIKKIKDIDYSRIEKIRHTEKKFTDSHRPSSQTLKYVEIDEEVNDFNNNNEINQYELDIISENYDTNIETYPINMLNEENPKEIEEEKNKERNNKANFIKEFEQIKKKFKRKKTTIYDIHNTFKDKGYSIENIFFYLLYIMKDGSIELKQTDKNEFSDIQIIFN